jgi:hypothetical protein
MALETISELKRMLPQPDLRLKLPPKLLSTVLAAGVILSGLNWVLPKRDFDVHPDHYSIFDDTLWRALRVPLLICGGVDKQDDWWQWYKQPIPEGFQGQVVNGDPDTLVRKMGPQTMMVSCGAWDQVYEVRPDFGENSIPPDFRWQYAYRGINDQTGQFEVSTHLNNGPVKVMIGPGKAVYYGITYPGGHEVNLLVSGPFDRYENSNWPLRIFSYKDDPPSPLI